MSIFFIFSLFSCNRNTLAMGEVRQQRENEKEKKRNKKARNVTKKKKSIARSKFETIL